MDQYNRKPSLRILFVHTRYFHSAGGEDTTLDAESALLRSKGHTVQTLLFDNASMTNGITGKLKAGVSAIYNSHSKKILSAAIEEFEPDIIHVHNFFFAASPSIFFEAANRKIPVVTTIQNFRLICSNALLLRQNKVCELCVHNSFPWHGVLYKCYHNSALQSATVGGMAAIHKWLGTWRNKVSAYITPSFFAREKLIASSFNAKPEKIFVKPNFVEDPGFSPGLHRSGFYLFVGRISAEKGVDILLKAWLNLPDQKLVVVGDGPEKELLEREYGHLENISFAGKKDHDGVIELMKHSRALVFPSIWYEGLPLTIIEAFATGTPVIASKLGAMEEMIQHGYNGLLFEKADIEQLREAVLSFESDNHRKDSMYDAARATYLTHYNPQKSYEIIMKIYNRVLHP